LTDITCPYCGVQLKKPKGGTCKNCQQFIFSREHPIDHKWGLVTQREARYIDRAKYFLKDPKLYQKIVTNLKSRFGKQPDETDVIWSYLCACIQEKMEALDWHSMKDIYYQQALILYEDGRDPFAILQANAVCDLHNWKHSGLIKKVKIIATKDSCQYCLALNGKTISLDEALEVMPIPVKDCGRGFCQCCYGAVLE
jgi:hypothetical protein